ncbi:MAG: FtsH protease activity modulator HflK [Hahellaceae bacterium]|nr:FtsH protease activity modulator HflK [Hahellaceae bacterium]MCP5170006.1 FtsH protease activity modulator HflK [Hahellaceae bacterium]
MAWNEPGGNRNDKDPWGGGNKGGDQGPPDLDEALRKGMERLNKMFGGSGQGGNSGGGSSGAAVGGLFILVALIVAVFLGSQSFYTVNEREQAVVMRFGKYHETVGAGFQFKLPLVDHIEKIDVSRVRSAVTRGHMLTEDENIVEVNLSVQYVVKDPKSFVLAIRNPERTLDYATDSALRHEVGSAELHQVMTEGRAVLAIRVQERLQRFLDFYNAGLQVSKVNIEDSAPPKEVRAAFQDVQRAKEDEQRVREEAEAYKNRVVPESRGRAQRIMEEANAYKSEVVARAEGDTARFLKLLNVYEKSPEVTRERLYLDTMERVMSSSSKVLVDVKGGNNMMYLPLDRMISSGSVPGQTNTVAPRAVTQPSSSDQVDLDGITDKVMDELRNRDAFSSRRGR